MIEPLFWPNRIVESGAANPQELAKGYNELNWRAHPETQRAALEEALDSLGWLSRVIVNKSSGHIIDGHLRVELAVLKGEALVPVDYVELTDDEEALALATLDAITEQAQPIPEKLAALLERTRAMTADKPGLGAMLEALRSRAGVNGTSNGNGQEPPAPTEVEAEKYHKKWQVKLGDVWQLGQHTIACLDSLDEANIKKIVGDSAVTFAFADPPYGINIVAANGYVGGGEAYDIPFGGVKQRRLVGQVGGLGRPDGGYPFGGAKNDGKSKPIGAGKYAPVAGDSTTETAKQSAALLLNLYPNACQVWWGANYYTDILPPSPCWIIWDKDNTGNFADCEMAWTNQPTAARIFEHRWNGMLKASEQGQRRIHPTQKPIALAKWAFETYGESGDVIIDPFLGSGITVLAAEELGDRRVIGFELEPVYISVVLERWATLTTQPPRLL
jgi:hypothetical protein